MEIGDVFTRRELGKTVGAGGGDYLLTQDGEVVAVAVDPLKITHITEVRPPVGAPT